MRTIHRRMRKSMMATIQTSSGLVHTWPNRSNQSSVTVVTRKQTKQQNQSHSGMTGVQSGYFFLLSTGWSTFKFVRYCFGGGKNPFESTFKFVWYCFGGGKNPFGWGEGGSTFENRGLCPHHYFDLFLPIYLPLPPLAPHSLIEVWAIVNE